MLGLLARLVCGLQPSDDVFEDLHDTGLSDVLESVAMYMGDVLEPCVESVSDCFEDLFEWLDVGLLCVDATDEVLVCMDAPALAVSEGFVDLLSFFDV